MQKQNVRGASLTPIRKPTFIDLMWVVLLGVSWGSAFPAIKVTIEAMAPMHSVMLRIAIGFVILMAWMLVRRIKFPRGRKVWALLAIMAVLNTLLPFFLLAWAEQFIGAGITAIMMGAGPFLALIISHLTTPDDKLSVPKLIGVALGFAGVMTIVGTEALSGADRNLLALLAVFSACLCYVISASMIRFVRNTSMEAMAAGNLIWAVALCVPLLFVVGVPPLAVVRGDVLFAILWLGIVGTGVNYLLRFHLAQTVGSSFMSLATNLVPATGVILSGILLGETISQTAILACALVIAGMSVSRLGR